MTIASNDLRNYLWYPGMEGPRRNGESCGVFPFFAHLCGYRTICNFDDLINEKKYFENDEGYIQYKDVIFFNENMIEIRRLDDDQLFLECLEEISKIIEPGDIVKYITVSDGFRYDDEQDCRDDDDPEEHYCSVSVYELVTD